MERSDVFLSYRRANVEFAKKINEALKATKREVWVDWEDIPPGVAGFTTEIERGIEGADTMICVLSPEYMQSEYCLMELAHGLKLNKRIVPIVYNKFDGNPPNGIGHINWVYFCPHAGQENPFHEAFAKVIAAIETDFEHVRSHTRLLLRAKEWDAKKRANGFLLNDGEVDEAQHWLGKGTTLQPAPLPMHVEYIVASHTLQAKRQRQARTTLTAGLALSLVLLVAAVIMTFFAEKNRIYADESRHTAEIKEAQAQSLALSANAKNTLNQGNSTLALALVRIAVTGVDSPSAEVRRTLAMMVYAPGARYRLQNSKGSVIAVAFHPTKPLFLSADATGDLILYNRDTGVIVHQVDLGQRITAAEFNRTGDMIAVALVDNTIQLLDTESGSVKSTLKGHSDSISAIAFDPSGTYLASGSIDRTVRLWNLATGTTERTFEHPGAVLRVVFSPDGTRLATSTADATVADDANDIIDRKARIWTVKTGDKLLEITPGSGFVRALAYSPDGKSLALGMLDVDARGTLVFYDMTSGEEMRRIFAHSDIVTNLTFSPDGAYVASTSWDGSVVVWDVQRQLLVQRFIGFYDRLLSLDYSPDGNYLLIGSGNVGNNEFVEKQNDTSVWLFDLRNGAEIRSFKNHKDWVWSAAISADGLTAATGSGPFNGEVEDSSIRLWNTQTGEETMRLIGHTQTVDSIAFHPDGKRLLSGGDNQIILWDLATGKQIRSYEGHKADTYVSRVQFNRAGTQFVSSAYDGTTRLWDTETGENIRTFVDESVPTTEVRDVSYNLDETQIATASYDGNIRLWDVATGKLLQTWTGHTASVSQVRFSPDGKYLASSSSDDTIRLWDVSTGKTVRQFLGHGGDVFGLAFNAAGTLLFSSSQDKTISIWDVATGIELHSYIGHTGVVTDVVLSPDEKTILSVSQDKTARIWRVDPDIPSLMAYSEQSRYIRDLTCDERNSYSAPLCAASTVTPQ